MMTKILDVILLIVTSFVKSRLQLGGRHLLVQPLTTLYQNPILTLFYYVLFVFNMSFSKIGKGFKIHA